MVLLSVILTDKAAWKAARLAATIIRTVIYCHWRERTTGSFVVEGRLTKLRANPSTFVMCRQQRSFIEAAAGEKLPISHKYAVSLNSCIRCDWTPTQDRRLLSFHWFQKGTFPSPPNGYSGALKVNDSNRGRVGCLSVYTDYRFLNPPFKGKLAG